jgi:hypothetical protein
MTARPDQVNREEMVLPVRIELTTSALPRMRSDASLSLFGLSESLEHLGFPGAD